MAMQRRRAKGEGSIVERADGRFMFVQSVGLDENGKRLRRTYYAGSRAALVRRLQDERAKAGGNLRPMASGTVRKLVEDFLAEREPHDDRPPKGRKGRQERVEISPLTYEGWERAWCHVEPHIGNLRLERFDCATVARTRSALLNDGLGTRTIALVWQVLKLAFDQGIRRKQFFGENPWRLERPPRHTKTVVKVLQDEEVPRFLAAAAKDPYEAAWLLMLGCGLRLGETLGLQWEDVDFGSGAIAVHRQLSEVNGESQLRRTKTEASSRTVYADARLLKALRKRRETTEKEGHGSTFLFCTSTGEPLTRANLRHRNLARICKAAEVSGITIHSLRHRWTLNTIDAGIAPNVAAQLGGWTSPRMLLERYGIHRREGLMREASLAAQKTLTRRRSSGRNGQKAAQEKPQRQPTA